jgi:ribosomal protein L11 methylase PrmA
MINSFFEDSSQEEHISPLKALATLAVSFQIMQEQLHPLILSAPFCHLFNLILGVAVLVTTVLVIIIAVSESIQIKLKQQDSLILSGLFRHLQASQIKALSAAM